MELTDKEVSMVVDAGLDYRDGYSGRGMFGAETQAIAGSEFQIMKFKDELLDYATETDDKDCLALLKKLNHAKWDSLGKGVVLY